jgi:signal transduction histidine kinase/CheY-like chemotaxis protein
MSELISQRQIETRTILILVVIALVVTFPGFKVLHNLIIEDKKTALREIVKSQAALMEAVAEYNASVEGGAFKESSRARTLDEIRKSYEKYQGFDQTGGLVLAEHKGDKIVFLFPSRELNGKIPPPVDFNSNIAGPMKLALSGKSGIVEALDHSGVSVITAYEYLPTLKMGLVAKVERRETYENFYQAGMVSLAFALIAILIGAVLNRKIVAPLLSRNYKYAEELIKSEDELAKSLKESESLQVKANLAKKEAERLAELAENANRAKSTFLSSMSHEIRTPMNAILGYSQILERDDSLNPKQKKGVQSIHRAGNHLLVIINDILDFSKIEAGKMEVHSHDFNLESLIQDMAVIFDERCVKKNLELNIAGFEKGKPIAVHGDAAKLSQVLVNLLGNAIKFTDSGRVCFEVIEQGKDHYRFSVSDSGKGIPKEKQKSIFEAFQQDIDGVMKGGTGLGLAISDKLVGLMGGNLEVESEPGKGARFFFTLQLPPSHGTVNEKDEKLIYARLAPGYKVKSVLIDDNQDNLDVLTETLREVGVETAEANNGPDGLKLVRKTQPNIVLVDYHMPNMDGLEVTKKIKAEYGEDKIKILMVSASTFDHHREMFMKEGVHGFIGKPFKREELLGALVRLLNVEFVGGEEANQQQPKELNFSSIKLTNELQASLKNAASLGRMNEFEKMLLEIEKLDFNGATDFAMHLRNMADRFDTEGIAEALEKVGTA